MKRSHVLVLSCACALVLALFGLSACGGGNSSATSSSSTSKSTASSSNSSSATVEPGADPNSLSEDEVRGVFEQVVANMSEFYKGTTPVGEELYYAGGADGANAIFALVVPETATSVIFVGPATVADDNKLTIQDETTGSSITFAVTSNEDGTISFSMGEEYGFAVMTKCKSSEIVDKLVDLVVNAPTNAQETQQQSDQQQQSQE